MAIADVTAHPLAPLVPVELERAAALVRERVDAARFVSIGLHDPPKAAYLAWVDGGTRPPRCALAIVVDAERCVRELVCDLDAGVVASEKSVPGAHAPITPEDYEAAAEAVRADAGWREALGRRGVDDVSLVQIDVLASGGFGLEVERGRRVARAVAYLLRQPGGNGYAHPIESLIAYVDLDELRVLELEELDVKPIPLEADGAYAAGSVPLRDDLRPIEIVQPEGVSFALEGNAIEWYRWSLCAAIDPQEGLVLHDVRFDGRPVLHRASCAEMIVPYGEPHAMHAWRTYFDAGEYGLGACTNSLALGCDCVGEIRYLDAHLVDRGGRPRAVRNAICLHEEDAGLLWKHRDELAGRVEVRRARRFVVNSMVTVGNYDYAFRWYLHLDGSIECEVQLHGIVSTMALAEGERPAGSSIVDRGLAAPNHQHFFCFRLDLDVDGAGNSVREVESEPVPDGPGNPLGNAFRARVTPLVRESVARRDSDDRAARVWHVVNPSCRNALGGETGYRLVPQYGVATMLAQPGARVSRRAGFARHTLWVTRYDDAERHPSGRYPYGQPETVGLPQWCEADRSLEDSDVVLWYTVGTTHFVRPEDWPVMPAPVRASGWSPSGSSTATRRSTSRRPAPATVGAGRPARGRRRRRRVPSPGRRFDEGRPRPREPRQRDGRLARHRRARPHLALAPGVSDDRTGQWHPGRVPRGHARAAMIRAMAGARPARSRSPWASDEHELFRETARAWVEREVVPNDARWQERGYVDAELWRSAGEAGLLGTDVPAGHGGAGGDFGFECVVYEELLHAGFACFGKGVHEIATHYVLDYGSDAQRATWVPRLVRGELVGAIAMTEPGAGSDLRGIATSAVRDGDDYVVNGTKTFITNGLHANLICLVARTDADAGSQGFIAADGGDRRARRLYTRAAAAQARPARAGHVRAALPGRARAGCGEPGGGARPLPADAAAALRAHRRRGDGGRRRSSAWSPTPLRTRVGARPSASR